MLKRITLKNFVQFEDETVIHLDASNIIADACNSPHIFVGANFSGKSTIIELIRRCMTDEINLTKTSLCLEDSVAYAFCKFDDNVISGIIAEPHQTENRSQTEYKFFLYDEKDETFFHYKSSNNNVCIYGNVVMDDRGKKIIKKLFGREIDGSSHENESNHENISSLLSLLKETKTYNPGLQDKPCWKTIENQYIATFPMRGIGIVQWTKSANIKDTSNYKKACERAEVISTLLREKGYNEKKEKEIFEFMTYPDVFTFTQNNGEIHVQTNGFKFPLLKTSEGIVEAKLTSLLLALDHIKTLCLEEPDRGMHPQMIERLKTMLCREACNKTIIVVAHSPYFIDNITINNTHVFFRKKRIINSNIRSLKKAKSCPELSKVSNTEKIRRCLFFTNRRITDSVKRVRSCSEPANVYSIEKKQSLLSTRKHMTSNNTLSVKRVRSCPDLSTVSDVEKMLSLLSTRKQIIDSNTCPLEGVRSCPELSILSDTEKLRQSLLFTSKRMIDSVKRVRSFSEPANVYSIEKKQSLLSTRTQMTGIDALTVKRVRSCPDLSKVSKAEKILSLLLTRKLMTDSYTCSDNEIKREEKVTDYSIFSLEKLRSIPKLSKVTDIDIIRTVLFATKVLLVEGAIDREVVQGIFTQYKSKKLKDRKNKIVEFNKDITTYQVVSVNGCKNIKRVREFCEFFHLPCLCLMDLDTIVQSSKYLKPSKNVKQLRECQKELKLKKRTKLIKGFSKIGHQKYLEKKYLLTSLSSFVAHYDSMRAAKSLESKENTFIWRHGAVEDAILSSPNLNEEICNILGLNCKSVSASNLKNKLRERLTMEEGGNFYAKLLNVEEIKRFIQFMEKKEECHTVYNSYCTSSMSEPKSSNFNLKFVGLATTLVATVIIVGLFGGMYMYNYEN